MRLDGPESQNVEDRRGQGGGFGGGFGGGGGMGRGGGIAVGGIGGVVLLVVCLLFGVDPSVILGGGDGAPPPQPAPQERRFDPGSFGGGAPRQAESRPQAQPQPQNGSASSEDGGRRFIAQVLGETEQVWNDQFQRLGRRYEEPVLVLFSGATRSGCGAAQAQTGPFYCPEDRKVYIDLEFMARLQRQLGAQGDFASAYIVAHEVGHHVQNLLGVLPQVQQAQARADGPERNQLQVRVELQADCFAGVWANQANRARHILEQGDIEEGLNAAAAVGDDRVTGGRISPESFTHGSSRQRATWFRRGLDSGDIRQCDTFNG
ncbi:KPN_02809 family neutral zinc metallopeptidase [Pararoseomonas indoligenes]|uniref:Neutral zinc metallopeptidase n=1 Tax=Roseomonas indoligenes TaxID=2820811 RepID=A0A940S506_9PROT|nr:neutral zinc metallopeptidase [Pararoseomonas indoligenes]MBP0492524.1 neutral zinc metallopeptidase [Pararoseomonas indoligenes]